MNDEIKPIPKANYGPGSVLRTKREEYEWSVEAVAEALHLSSHAVRAIEADRYEDLPGATYVMGYWRSYARLLGIDLDDTIEANKRNLNIIVPEPAGLDVSRAYVHKTGSSALGWIILLSIIAALGYYTWRQDFFGWFDVVRTTPNAVENSELSSLGTDLDNQLEMSEASNGVLRATADSVVRQFSNIGRGEQPSDNGLTLSQSQSSSGTDPNTLVAQAKTKNAQAVVDEKEQSVTESSEPKPATTTNTAALKPALEAAQEGAADDSTMIFTFSKDSWLDVRDKTNKRLVYKTEKAGNTLKVSGTPPFYIYIGTPSGVTLSFKGKDVPFQTHKSGLFSRFKLGETLESL